MKYRFVDHTAGRDLPELIENARYAFYDPFVNVSRIGSSIEKTFTLE